jgi:fatty acid desaturase
MQTDDKDLKAAPDEDPIYRRARKRAEELQGFYIHLVVYATVNLSLFAINALTRGENGGWWFYWPLLGWGIALIIHALTTFGGVFSEDWRERKAEELYERSRRDAA